MMKVGITGNMGSGKSLISQVFLWLGIPVLDADSLAKDLMNTRVDIQRRIIQAFGPEAFQNGVLQRAFVAEKAFHDASLLEKLNRIVHPAVRQAAVEWFDQLDPALPYALEEAALLVESGSYQVLDYLILVTAPEALRIRRVMQRDGHSYTHVKARMDHQWPEERKRKVADFIITNDGNSLLLPQVVEIHEKLSQIGGRSEAGFATFA